MLSSNIDLLSELYEQTKARVLVDTCLQAKDGSVFAHWAMLVVAGNDWLVDANPEDSNHHTIIFPDHTVEELESCVRRLYCQAPNTPFETCPNTPAPEIFHTAPETPHHHAGILDSPQQQRLHSLDVSIKLLECKLNEALEMNDMERLKEIDVNMSKLLEERFALGQKSYTLTFPQFPSLPDLKEDADLKEEIEDELNVEESVLKEEIEDELNVEESVLCPVCGLSFKSKTALSVHKTSVHQVSLSVCQVCGKSCDNRKGLRNHMRTHKKKTCDICDKEISPTFFKQHRQACSMQPPETFNCALCKFKCETKRGLNDHIKTHAEAPFFKCKFCSYASHDKSNLRKHIQDVHRTKKFQCNKCTRKFNSFDVLQRHIRNVHEGPPPEPEKNIWFNCEKCSFKSKWKCNAIRHKNVHLRNLRSTSKQPNICYHCGMTFTRKWTLKRHQKRCKTFLTQRITDEQCVGLMNKGFNKTDVNVVLKLFRRICGRGKVQRRVMNVVDSSIKDLRQWFTSETIVLRNNPEPKSKDKIGKEFTTCVSYCHDLKGFIKFVKIGRKMKNAHFLISGND